MTLPILRSLARRHGPLGVVHFDAHPDTWDEYFGHKYFHGTPFRRAVEEGVVDPRRFIQIGIRGPLYGPEDFAFHDQHGIEAIRIEAVKEHGVRWVGDRGFERLRGWARLLLVRHRCGRSRLRAGHGDTRGRGPDVLRGAGARARPGWA